MKTALTVSRILTGSLFILSGFVKAVDPLGFSYKLVEYFGVFGTEFMNPFAESMSIFFSVLEILLGFMLLFGIYGSISAILLLLLIVFFTFLTFYSAWFDVVKDCGCFGDALKLTPWESFWKDVVLLFFSGLIFFQRKWITFNTDRENQIILLPSAILIGLFSFFMFDWPLPFWFSLAVFSLFILVKKLTGPDRAQLTNTILGVILLCGFTFYNYLFLPVKDFRAYKIGNHIPSLMTLPADAKQDIWETTLVYKNNQTGEIREVDLKNIPKGEEWQWQDTKNVLVQKGDEPKIKDFIIFDENGYEITDLILEEPGYSLIVVAYDLSKTSKSAFEKLNKLAAAAEKENIPTIVLTGSLLTEADKFRHVVQAAYPFYNCDPTVLKTIIRSNPGLLLLNNGTVKGKWPARSIPDFSELNLYSHSK